MQTTKPQLKAILTCDNIIAEKGIPASYFPIYLYLAFSGAGDFRIRVSFHDLTEDKEIASSSLPQLIHCPDRLKTYQVIFRLPPLPLPQEGDYDFIVYANDEIIAQRTINVIQRK
jgi:hypothetical protein